MVARRFILERNLSGRHHRFRLIPCPVQRQYRRLIRLRPAHQTRSDKTDVSERRELPLHPSTRYRCWPRSIFHQHIVRVVDIQPRSLLRYAIRSTLPNGSRRKIRCRKTVTKITSSTVATTRIFLTLFLLVIFLFRVDAPKRGFIDVSRHKAIDRCHRGQHAVVLVVVLMHSVSAHQKQVLESVGKLA